jgi:arabinan endo-1,5-alpha-L-arabinosidase
MQHSFKPYLLVLLLVLTACNGSTGQAAQPTSTVDVEPVAQASATPEAVEATATLPRPTATERPSPTATPTLEPGTFVNPVLDADFPDPDVLKVGDTYYAYATNTGNKNIQVATSTDLVNWELGRDALPSLPGWADLDFGFVWAPEVTVSADGQTFVMYYTARFKMGEGGRQCIGVATSDTPEGPFRSPNPEPFICQHDQGGSIDASTFVDEDGSRYVLWKNDGNCCSQRTYLYIQPVSDDGLTLMGEPTQLITTDKAWEGILVEAPTLWKQDGKYHLFYSANDYASPRYAVGYAVSDNVLGPYEKPSPQPFIESSIPAGVIGPGGQDIVVGPDGETTWMLYHAWDPESFRHMRLDQLLWEETTPVLDGPEREPDAAP